VIWHLDIRRIRSPSRFSLPGHETRFVHWSPYEKTQMTQYVERYGDRGGVAARVIESLFDLYAEMRRCVVLPLPSYSLKLVEEYVGFERSQTEFGGDWSITIWDEIIETADESQRRWLMDSLATYNDEDLLGMWAVYSWLDRHSED